MYSYMGGGEGGGHIRIHSRRVYSYTYSDSYTVVHDMFETDRQESRSCQVKFKRTVPTPETDKKI